MESMGKGINIGDSTVLGDGIVVTAPPSKGVIQGQYELFYATPNANRVSDEGSPYTNGENADVLSDTGTFQSESFTSPIIGEQNFFITDGGRYGWVIEPDGTVLNELDFNSIFAYDPFFEAGAFFDGLFIAQSNFGDGFAVAVEEETGQVAWDVIPPQNADGVAVGKPTKAGGNLIIPSATGSLNELYLVEVNTSGDVVQDNVFATPSDFTVSGPTSVALGSNSNKLYLSSDGAALVVDRADLSLINSYTFASGSAKSPVDASGFMYINSSTFDEPHLKIDPENGTTEWTVTNSEIQSAVSGSPTLSKAASTNAFIDDSRNEIIFSSTELRSDNDTTFVYVVVDKDTGSVKNAVRTDILLAADGQSATPNESSYSLTNGTVITQCDANEQVAELDPRDGTIFWSDTIPKATATRQLPPTLDGGKVYYTGGETSIQLFRVQEDLSNMEVTITNTS